MANTDKACRQGRAYQRVCNTTPAKPDLQSRDTSFENANYELETITRFFTMDRFSEKYVELSPYQYTANNPIRFIDVNGDWIYIYHEGQRYKYDNGNLYQYQTEGDNAGKYTEYTAKEGSFLHTVQNGLTELGNKTETGEGLVSFFSNDDNDAYIRESSTGENYIDMDTQSNNIYLTGEGSMIPTENGVEKSPFWLDVGHELAHKQDFILNGDQGKKTWIPQSANSSLRGPIYETEKYATHIENKMRGESGLSLRTHYVRQGNGGWEKSRILDSNGHSMYNFHTEQFNFGGVIKYTVIVHTTIPHVYRINK